MISSQFTFLSQYHIMNKDLNHYGQSRGPFLGSHTFLCQYHTLNKDLVHF